MDDKDLPEDISLADFLTKAEADPDLYHQMLKLMKSGKQVVLQRQPSERWINQYNPSILQTWQANHDLQFILNPEACIMYVTSYMTKSERATSELLNKVAQENKDSELKSKLRKVGSAFLQNREVSSQEAAFRLLSLPLKRASRKVVFANTAPKDIRVSMLKPHSLLQEMDDDDENIFFTSALDRYASRPDLLENMSGKAVNRSIIIAADKGILAYKNPTLLPKNGGSIHLDSGWAQSLMKRMNLVKR